MGIVFEKLDGPINVPTVAVETDLKSGNVGTPSLARKVLALGYKLTAGTAADNTPYQITSVAQARTLFGAGSHLAVMVEAIFRVSPRIRLWAMAYAEGGAAVAATGTISLATTATGPGTLRVWICGRLFCTGVAKDDTPDDVGAAIAAVINAATNLPVTASYATNDVTLTARNKGPEGNTIRFRSEITSSCGMTATDSGEALTSGATAGDPTTALTAVVGDRYHLIVGNTDDATALGAIQDHQEAQSEPLVQKWGFGVGGAVGTLTAATTLAGNLDSYRMLLPWLPSSDQPVFEVAAAHAAERARCVTMTKTLNGHVLPGLTAPYKEADWPETADEEAALAAGVTPLRPERSGDVKIVRSITTKVNDDSPFIDDGPWWISDFQDEDLITQYKRRYGDAVIKPGAEAGTPDVLSEANALAVLHERMRLWDEKLNISWGAEADIKGKATKAELNASNPCRIDTAYPFRPVHGGHVIAVKKSYTTAPVTG